MLSFITIPSATDMIASSSAYSTAIFNELITYALAVLGLIIGALLVRFIVLGGVKGAVTKITGKGRRGGRRRRR